MLDKYLLLFVCVCFPFGCMVFYVVAGFHRRNEMKTYIPVPLFFLLLFFAVVYYTIYFFLLLFFFLHGALCVCCNLLSLVSPVTNCTVI